MKRRFLTKLNGADIFHDFKGLLSFSGNPHQQGGSDLQDMK
jgi:hypothetical protein